ncbi:AMP-binding protein [Yoonia sp. R2-816]|uniref:AMP-binding protein n=1 Tax=Yoonia sp. R2-816 TaxID=3342638 RepID=UPI003727F742
MTRIDIPTNATRPWLASYPDGVPADLPEDRPATLVEIVRETARRHPDRPAYESFGATLTFAQSVAAAERVAAALADLGLRPGDRIAIMMPNVLTCPVSILGAMLGGFVVVNVNPLYTASELKHQVRDAGARALIVLENHAHVIEAACPTAMGLEHVVVAKPGDLMGPKGYLVNLVSRRVKRAVKPYRLPGAIPFRRLLRSKAPFRAITPASEDVALLQYTGGTTGVAKGAVLTHASVSANVAQLEAWLRASIDVDRDGHRMAAALPLYHIFGFTVCFMTMMRIGASCVLIANPRDVGGFVSTLDKGPVTMISGVNTLYNALLNHPKFRSVDMAGLVFAIAGGMATQRVVAERWKAATGVAIVEGWGLSESSPVATANRLDLADFSGHVGYPLPGTEVLALADDGAPVPQGEVGELAIRGPQVMRGYWNRPEATAEVLSDGLLRTGDLGMIHPDGAVEIFDRKKDMIIVSGFNVFPNEVEEVVAAHPAILEVAVAGLPSETAGEAVAAFVVLREGQSLTLADLRAFCGDRLTPYKCPTVLEIREELPKTAVGKFLRRELREKGRAV